MSHPETNRVDAPSEDAPSMPTLPWRDVCESIFRHPRIILAAVVIGAAAMGLIALFDPPLYEAQAKLMLASNRADVKVSPEQGTSQIERIDETLVNSEATWLRSDGVLREVMEPWRAQIEGRGSSGVAAFLKNTLSLPFEIPAMVYRFVHDAPEPTQFDRWVAGIQRRLQVNSTRASDVIEMSYRDQNPGFAAQVLNALIAYRMKRQTSFSQQSEAVAFYDEQTRLLADRVHQAQEALRDFYEREGIVGGPEERKGLRDRLAEIRTERARAAADLAQARVRVDFLQKALRDVPERIAVPNTSASAIESRVLDLMLERSKLLATYSPKSVKIVDIDQQIAEAQRVMREQKKLINDISMTANPTFTDLNKEMIETQAQLVALEAKSETLAAQESGYVDQVRRLVTGTSTLERLETDLDRAREAHRTYVAKREDARFSSALDASQIVNINVIEPATTPATPEPGRGALDMILGAVAGLVLGAALAFVRDLVDPTVKSTAEVARLTGMPILGEVSTAS